MSIKLETKDVAGVRIIGLSGRLTLGEGSSLLRDSVRQTLASGQKKILLNLAELSYMDSSGMGELVSAYVTTNNQGGKLKLLNLSDRVQNLLLITKLLTIFEVYDREETAIRSFDTPAA